MNSSTVNNTADISDQRLYQLVQCVDGKLVTTVFTAEQFLPALEVRGFVTTGISGHRLRRELQDQPTFSGLCGPMWGGASEDTGIPIVRYEDAETNDLMSN
jgi:hypothetical protein